MSTINKKVIVKIEEHDQQEGNRVFRKYNNDGGFHDNDRVGSRLWNWNKYMEKTIQSISISKKTPFKVNEDQVSLDKALSNSGNPQKSLQKCIKNKNYNFQKQSQMEYSQQNDESQNYKANNQENLQTSLLKIDSQVRIRRGFQWKVSSGILKGGQIMFFITHYKIALIDKLKILTQSIDETQFHTIKFNYGNQCIYFGAPIDNFCMKMNYHFGWFIGVVLHKLSLQKYLGKPIFKQKKVRLSKQTDFKFSGPILKRSQYLGKWCQRWVIVNQKGLFFYNLQNSSQKHSFSILAENIKYIWTRFQIYNQCLVLKVKHGIRKTQLAFPIVELFDKQFSWLLQIYNLMMFRKQ